MKSFFKFKKSKSISLYFVHLFDLLKKSSEKINQTLIFYAFLKTFSSPLCINKFVCVIYVSAET